MGHAPDGQRTRYGPRRRSAPGSPPGTLLADPQAPAPRMRLFSYDPSELRETRDAALDDVAAAAGPGRTLWLDVDGLGDADTIERIGRRFSLHPLALEDVVDVHQRPKFEAYDDHLFLIVRVPLQPRDASAPRAAGLHTEQVAICLGREHVVTFQEAPGDAFEPVRHRLRASSSALRRHGADYLAYALVDAAIDAYFPLLEAYGERLEALEAEVVDRPRREHVALIHDLKRDLLTVRRAVWPLRDLLAAMLRDDTPLVAEHTRVYLRDCLDHATQLIDMVETYREIASGLVDIHLSSVSNRMNEVMKMLTIIATIFIPLTFLAGLYGMNFDPAAGPWSMPELGWRYGYPAVLALMAAVAGGLLLYFRRLGWIGRGARN
jgi:magnesium transporter